MSRADVEAVFGPQWVQDALERSRSKNELAEKAILGLRCKLKELDPSLPDIYDGTRWWPFESAWTPRR